MLSCLLVTCCTCLFNPRIRCCLFWSFTCAFQMYLGVVAFLLHSGLFRVSILLFLFFIWTFCVFSEHRWSKFEDSCSRALSRTPCMQSVCMKCKLVAGSLLVLLELWLHGTVSITATAFIISSGVFYERYNQRHCAVAANSSCKVIPCPADRFHDFFGVGSKPFWMKWTAWYCLLLSRSGTSIASSVRSVDLEYIVGEVGVESSSLWCVQPEASLMAGQSIASASAHLSTFISVLQISSVLTAKAYSKTKVAELKHVSFSQIWPGGKGATDDEKWLKLGRGVAGMTAKR